MMIQIYVKVTHTHKHTHPHTHTHTHTHARARKHTNRLCDSAAEDICAAVVAKDQVRLIVLSQVDISYYYTL